MTKAAMTRLNKSEFFREVRDVIVAWDYALYSKDRETSDALMHKWEMAKLALEFITGDTYGFSRNDETISLVNERNYDDRLFVAKVYRDKPLAEHAIGGEW